ncbi:MAG: SpoIIE family protein phosphatase [Victivallales bacterium]|nr:SpoIIE family protein phosphatase [Victivallales bacterium]
MPYSEILENLRSSVLFEQSPDPVLEEIAKIVRLISIEAGEKLIVKGEHDDAMYIICDGKVKVHDGDLTLAKLGKGHAFGEMAALDGEVRTASITAAEKTRLIQLNRDDLFALIEREPQIAKSLIHFLCQRGKNIINDITERSLKLRTLEREFEIAHDIQAGFLPESIPEVEGWEISAYFHAAKEVAGDFYDVFEIGKCGKVALIVGDVCGKGVGAALFMSLFRSLLRSSLLSGDFMGWSNKERVNKELTQIELREMLLNSVVLTNNYVARTHAEACMFSTLFVAILDPSDGSLIYVNAGHEAPIIFNGEEIVERISHTGPVAGLFAEEEFAVGETKLDPGESLLAFTDGVPEAVNTKNEQFTEALMIQILMTNTHSLKDGMNSVVEQLKTFTKNMEQFDDITLLGVRRSVNSKQ